MKALSLEHGIREKHPLYSPNQALSEAQRCLYCFDPPCVKACPTQINIPKFIRQIAAKDNRGAAKTILGANILGGTCARICPVEVLCAGACVYEERGEAPIEIGRLQRFATSMSIKEWPIEELLGPPQPKTDKSIAVIGAGPASIAAGAMLALAGHRVVIFEKRAFAGGLNAAGIAPYKLKHEEALAEIHWLAELGLEFRLGHEISDNAKEIERDYDAIFMGMGLGADKPLDIPGVLGANVYGACDLIEKIKTDAHFSLTGINRAHVIGGGNTAIDIAHELCLLGVPYVAMHYRGDESSMSGYRHELGAARESGVHLWPNSQLTKIIHADSKLVGFYTQGSNELIGSDLIALAIGQSGATKIASYFSRVRLDARGLIQVDPRTHRTDNPKIWSAGDCVNGGKEVVNAVAEAKIAVASMLSYLRGVPS